MPTDLKRVSAPMKFLATSGVTTERQGSVLKCVLIRSDAWKVCRRGTLASKGNELVKDRIQWKSIIIVTRESSAELLRWSQDSAYIMEKGAVAALSMISAFIFAFRAAIPR